VNTDGVLWDDVPHDAFAAIGYNTNFCCVMPSLDLVVARIGDGPAIAPEPYGTPLLAAVARAVADALVARGPARGWPERASPVE
jgi:hypothetical protein